MSSHNNQFYSSDVWIRGSAKAKAKQLWYEVAKDKRSSHFPGTLDLAKIFLYPMSTTTGQRGDAMKTDWTGTRKKLIHSVGVTGQVKFVPANKHYSGIFQGSDYGIIRLSSAAKPTKSGQPLAPGMGLKFFRDGMDSSNLVSMFSLDGQQGEWDFFAHDFWTIV